MATAFDGVLVDNDALSLLAAGGLLVDALALYGFDVSQAYRLEAVTHMLRRRQIGKKWTDDARSRAAREAAAIQVWDRDPDTALFDRFTGVTGIDPGEAAFLTSLVERRELVMMTGDKRALIALASTPEIQDLREQIAGRILCLEEVLDALVEAHGARAIGEALAECHEHRTLSVVFTSTTMANDAMCREHIASYRRDLVVAVGPNFLYARESRSVTLESG